MLITSRDIACLILFAVGLAPPQLAAGAPPPPGAFVPGELRLAGSSRVQENLPIQISVWAIRPELPYHYSGITGGVAPRAELKLELRNAQGKWVGGGEPRLRHGKWQEMMLAPEGLKPGRYEAVLTLIYDDLPFNRVSKRISVQTSAEMAATPVVSALEIAKSGSLRTQKLDGDRIAVVLPQGRELVVPLSGKYPMVVYGTFSGSTATFQSSLSGQNLEVNGWGPEYLNREVYLGFGNGETDQLVLEAGKSDLLLTGLRFELVSGEQADLAGHSQPGPGDKAVVINNDGFSEGFYDPTWNIEKLPLQVLRYKETDATQLDWCVLVSDVVSYRSSFAEFFGENHSGIWATKGEKAAAGFFQELDQHEPKMVPWLVAIGREIGLPIWGSLRMSVSYGNHPFGKAFNGSMWHAHPEWRVKKSPVDPDDNDNPLSFAFSEVQNIRIGVLAELAEMGCEGVNLDYCRYPLIMGYDEPLLKRFQEAHGEDGKDAALDDPRWVQIRQAHHNDFLRDLRRRLDQVGKARGKRVPISIRLPATKYETFGFDPRTWIKEGLVDVLIPGYPGLDRWFDAEAWTKMVVGSKVEVLVNMEFYRHETALTELTDEQVAQGVKPGYQFKNVHEDYLRRAAEVYPQGADGMYIFNRWLEPGIFLGLSDAKYLRNWQEFQNPDNLDSIVIVK